MLRSCCSDLIIAYHFAYGTALHCRVTFKAATPNGRLEGVGPLGPLGPPGGDGEELWPIEMIPGSSGSICRDAYCNKIQNQHLYRSD